MLIVCQMLPRSKDVNSKPHMILACYSSSLCFQLEHVQEQFMFSLMNDQNKLTQDENKRGFNHAPSDFKHLK